MTHYTTSLSHSLPLNNRPIYPLVHCPPANIWLRPSPHTFYRLFPLIHFPSSAHSLHSPLFLFICTNHGCLWRETHLLDARAEAPIDPPGRHPQIAPNRGLRLGLGYLGSENRQGDGLLDPPQATCLLDGRPQGSVPVHAEQRPSPPTVFIQCIFILVVHQHPLGHRGCVPRA